MIEWRKTAFEAQELERLSACDLCGASSEKSKRLFTKTGLPANRCSVCGLMYVNPRLRQDILWQRYSEEYFQNEYLPIHGQYQEQRNYNIHAPVLHEIEQFVPNGRMFEFGAAIGLFLAAARLDGWLVEGNELSPFAADYAGQHFNLAVSVGRAEDVQASPGTYDAVALWETIEHVQSPRMVLQRAADLLRPGGVLALSTPNAGGVSYFFLRNRWWIVAPREHIYYFTPKTITLALRRAGLKVRRIRTAGTDLFYFFNTLLGREVMPVHIRATIGQDPAAALQAKTRLGLITRIRAQVEPWVIPFLQRVVHRTLLADQLIVYATKET